MGYILNLPSSSIMGDILDLLIISASGLLKLLKM